MITILGYSVDQVTALQIGVTVVIVFTYLVATSLREQQADHKSDCWMVIVVAFLIHHHPQITKLDDVVGVDPAGATTGEELGHFSTRLDNYLATGALPSFANAAETTVLEHLLFILGAPVLTIAGFAVLREEGRRTYKIRHTDIRKNYLSKMAVGIIGCLGYIWIAALLEDWNRTTAMIVGGLGVLGIIGGIAGALRLVRDQQGWKAYWNDRFVEVLAIADKNNDHDCFNRALLLNHTIDREPDLPVPGQLAFYTAIYSGVQALIVFGLPWLQSL